MDANELMELALESGLIDKDLSADGQLMTDYGDATVAIRKFYALSTAKARAEEREACAVLCDNRAHSSVGKGKSSAEWCAAAIRARKD